ncbi:MAG: YggS family pyridoxal phosphate-dependent enzyme [Planctomycetaceae bacterium]
MFCAANYRAVCDRVVAACARSNRAVSDVRLVAVTKYAPIEAVRELIGLGHRDLGESRPQQLLERSAQLPGDVNWHLIGTLQRNKARKLLPAAAMIHSVDGLRLLETLDRLAEELSLHPRLLLEVNVSGEASKHGFGPEDLRAVWPQIAAFERLDVAGLMTMAPFSDDPETARPHFRALRELRDELAAKGPNPLTELSMGMSGDFEVAIEEGATCVRIGSLLFDE